MRPLFIFGIACRILTADVSYRIDTVAGSDYIGDNGPAAAAILFQADGIAADGSGNLYVSDAANHRIRKIARAGAITTFAGTGTAGFWGDGGPAAVAQLNSPYGLSFDGLGNLYVADLGNSRVRRISADGTMTTVAGGGSLPAGGPNDGTAATLVALSAPRNLAWDGRGSVYISDFTGHRVYRLSPDGSLVTAAGTGIAGFSGDGAAAIRAQLSYPAGIAVDVHGDLYIGDSQNHLIRKVTSGTISSIARAATPTGMTVDAFGTLYVADPSAGQLLTVPIHGAATAFPIPAFDLCFAPDGYVYTTDGKLVHRISFTGLSTLIAGGGNLAYGDHGNAVLARLNHPSGVAADQHGNIFIADRDNHRIRLVAPDGTITTVAGTGEAGNGADGLLATLTALNAPSSVASDSNGNLYIADTGNQRVRVLTPDGTLRSVPAAGIGSPVYVLPDASGNVYIADSAAGAILEVMTDGRTVTIATGLKSPRGLALDSTGNLYVTEMDGRHVKRFGTSGDVTLLGEGIWSVPCSVAVDADGNVFVADSGLHQILRVDSSGVVSPIAGTGSAGFSGDTDTALAAEVSAPWDVAMGPNGTLYIADLDNNRIRQLTPGLPATLSPTAIITAVNAASLQPGPIAPGMLLDLLGTGITSTNSAQVLFNSLTVPLVAADSTRALVRVPPEIAGATSTRILVLDHGNLIGEISAAVTDAAPALFANATGQLIAANEDGTVNSADNPASRGSIVVLYGTGEGVTGSPVSVTIGGYTAEMLYAGPVAGYPGLLQINARIPAGYVPPGNLSVVLTVGQALSQAGVTIAVN